MIGPFDTTPVIARLKAQVPAFRLVEGAAEFAAAVESAAAVVPAAYVVLTSEDGQPPSGGSVLAIQAIRVRVSVVIAARNYRVAALGTAQADSQRALSNASRTALVKWKPGDVPPEEIRAFHFVSGRLRRYDNATVWWEDIYETTYWSRT